MKKTKLGIALLLMLAFVVTTGTFAYWASGITGNNDSVTGNTVDIGTGDAVTTTVAVTSSDTGGDLVPSGRATGTQVESVVYTFPVTWSRATGNDTFDGDSGTLAVSITNIQVNGGTTYASLANVVVTTNPGSVTLGGSAVDVVITVTLDEPADQTEYDAVAGNDITFDVTFTVTP